MTPLYPDYSRSIVNIPCSLQRALGISPAHPTLPEIDALSPDQYENLVLFLIDGMGEAVIGAHTRAGGFFQSHRLCTLTSTFPSTTVAATTSARSGLSPIEHGWLGWNCFFPSLQENVTVFKGVYAHTEIPVSPPNLADTLLAFSSLVEQARERGRYSRYITCFAPPYPEEIGSVCSLVEEECLRPGKKFLYAYVDDPDRTMHRRGVHSPETRQVLRQIGQRCEQLCRRLPERTLVLFLADHGHMDVEGVCLADYPPLLECLRVHPRGRQSRGVLRTRDNVPLLDPSLDPRAVAFFLEPGKEDLFQERFLEIFGRDFLLFSREEALSRQLFGPGLPHPQAVSMLGDFVAAGIGRKAIYMTRRERRVYIGHHTGLTEEEMRIPVLAVSI